MDSTACHHCLTGCSVPFLSCLQGLASYSALHVCNAYIAIYDLFSALAFKPIRIQHLQCDWLHAPPGGTVQWLHADYQIHREQSGQRRSGNVCRTLLAGSACFNVHFNSGNKMWNYVFICTVCTSEQANCTIFTLLWWMSVTIVN